MRELHETVRKHCTDEKEYKRCMDGIRSSVLTAFYTPPVFVRAIADTIYRTGDISAERMLDPSAGTGVFAEAFSGEGRAAETVCFEKDPLTGAILGKLFPGYEVHTDSFHRINSDYNGSFDLVASNIPFGTMQVFDAAAQPFPARGDVPQRSEQIQRQQCEQQVCGSPSPLLRRERIAAVPHSLCGPSQPLPEMFEIIFHGL